MTGRLVALAAAVAFAVVAGPAASQDDAGAAPEGVVAWFEAARRKVYLEEKYVIASGHVQVRWKGGSLRCDHAVLWGGSSAPDSGGQAPGSDSGEASLEVAEIYAEGEIVITRGERVHTLLEGSRAYLDLVNDRALVFDATLSTRIEGRQQRIPIILRAGEIRQVARDRFEALDVSMTTNPFAGPGYQVTTEHARLQIDPPAPKPGGRPGETVRNVRYEIDGSVLQLGDLPILPAPPISGNTEETFGLSWLKRFAVDRSGKFGPAVFLDVGADITADEEKWGSWTVRTRYLGDRGPGIGVDLRYRTDEYRGDLKTFYQNDHGSDEIFGDPPNNDRGRVLWRHRHALPEDIQLDLEFSKLSDRGFLAEYHEGEFKSDKEQETLIYLKRAVENRAATLLVSTRLNGFQDQVEFQPQVGYNLISEPIFDLENVALYFDADYEVSRARRRFDDATRVRDQDAFRTDLDNKVTLPFFLGPVKVQPFAGFRYTYYSNGRLSSRSFNRIGTLFGAKATTQLSRTFDVSGGLLGLNGLRHIITPEIEYLNVSHVSHAATDFIQFDEIDTFSELEAVRVGVRNRLQTLWETDGEPEVVDFLDLDIEWTYFPQPARDNFGDHAGNLDVDFLLRLTPELTYLADFEYSFVLDTYEVFNTALGWAPSAEFQVAVGYRRYVGVNDAVFVQTQWRPSERLGIQVYSGFDFQEDQFLDQRLTIQRIGVDWVFQVEVSYDNAGDFGFGISFTPRALFDPRLRAESLRHEPRLADFSDQLLK